MKKVKVDDEEIEFLEEKDIGPLFDKLLQAAGRRGVPERLIDKKRGKILKLTRKAEKAISKGKPKSEALRSLRETTKRLEDIVKDPPSYPGTVMGEILRSI